MLYFKLIIVKPLIVSIPATSTVSAPSNKIGKPKNNLAVTRFLLPQPRRSTISRTLAPSSSSSSHFNSGTFGKTQSLTFASNSVEVVHTGAALHCWSSPFNIFDALVASLPISETGEEAQLKRIAELQAENDAICQELQKQLEAAGHTRSNLFSTFLDCGGKARKHQ
ncbi:uncharacterized protein LOC131598006 [Vicia villosa]|uniref:uncharacterized protein LOC131598006 n=1 Tax=Vicia villosa TaxID=3911 RepID=UPI00273B2A86|nr:uncharacterized protein LOC131598006 [Vicia villosa]